MFFRMLHLLKSVCLYNIVEVQQNFQNNYSFPEALKMSKNWQRACTTRLYVHPPKSERFYTLWREGKICFGENDNPITDYLAQRSSAIWFVDGDGEQLDFKRAEYVMQPEGIPVHGLVNSVGDLQVALETFAVCERYSTCYVKLTLTNRSDFPVREKFGFVLRTAQEKKLLFDSPDNYGVYAPMLDYWEDLPASWVQDGSVFRDGERTLKTSGDLKFILDGSTGAAFAEFDLAPNGSRSAVFAYNIGEFRFGDYDAERAKVIHFWEDELARINKLPEKIANNPEQLRLIKNLVVHILQCFCYSKGNDYLLSRQGGLQRQIWTGEADVVLAVLPRIGDFDEYVEAAIDTYFHVFWTQTGEVVPFGIWWAMQTGNVLYSFSKYAMERGKEYFAKYREKAVKSFSWMRQTRASTVASDKVVAGLYPPLSSCDDELVFQNWNITDSSNVRALRAFLAACRQFDDPITAEVQAELDDYVSVLKKYWKLRVEQHADSEEMPAYYAPIGENAPYEKIFIFAASAWSLINALDVDAADCEKFIKYLENRRLKKGGLYHKMPGIMGPRGSLKHSCNAVGKSVVWYVSTAEFAFFQYFMRHGMLERCEEIIRDQIRFAMTDEYYMIERFHEDNPWFIPWSPNASANGRLIAMLLDFYG